MQNINLKRKLKKANENFDNLCLRHRKLERSVEKPKSIDLDSPEILKKNKKSKDSSSKDLFKQKLKESELNLDFEFSTSSASNSDFTKTRFQSIQSQTKIDYMKITPEIEKKLSEFEFSKIECNFRDLKIECDDVKLEKKENASYLTNGISNGEKEIEEKADNEQRLLKYDYRERLNIVYMKMVKRLNEALYEEFLESLRESIRRGKNCETAPKLFVERMKKKVENNDPLLKTLFKSYKQ